MEGVTLGMNYGLHRLAELGAARKTNPRHRRRREVEFWRQLMADIQLKS